MTHRFKQCLIIASLCLGLSACSQKQTLFSEFPGFDHYFASNQPSDALPDATAQALLTQYRPRVFMAEGQPRFIDFYQDYIANGALYVDDELVSNKVDQALLNQYKADTNAEFRHKPSSKAGSPVVYGRIDQDVLEHDGKQYPLTFLNYNLVFPKSGLLKGLSTWQYLAMETVGDTEDWHQLDHYVGLAVVLYQNQPLAVMLQQHNYKTTWLLTDQKTSYSTTLAADNRIAVDVALQSNELYLHRKELTRHPGISFVDADTIEFYKTAKNKPMMAGWDITHGQQEQDYQLKFLPASDAFYTFKGRLGENRKLPGRDGPPGAQYVTLPDLMPWSSRLVSSFRPGSLEEEKAKLEKLLAAGKFKIDTKALEAYTRDFVQAAKAQGKLP